MAIWRSPATVEKVSCSAKTKQAESLFYWAVVEAGAEVENPTFDRGESSGGEHGPAPKNKSAGAGRTGKNESALTPECLLLRKNSLRCALDTADFVRHVPMFSDVFVPMFSMFFPGFPMF